MERRRFASCCFKFGQFVSVPSLTLFIFIPNPSRACRRHRPLLLLLHFHQSFFAISSIYNRRTRERYIDAYGFRISIKDFGVSHANLDEYHKLIKSLRLKDLDWKMTK
ncbi:hypothetical protein QL285_031766 [Trifolium repens]|nr:hypothetical protein QL285_031766 [Trifolium repens]